MKKLLLSLLAAVVCTTLCHAEIITLDFTETVVKESGSWSNSYDNSFTNDFGNVTLNLTNFSKQTGTITDRPVFKGAGSATVSLKDPNAYRFKSIKFTGKKWNTKAQTMVLKYSTDGKTFQDFTDKISSADFTVEATNIPEDATAIQLSFTNTSNQIGLDCIEYVLSSTAPKDVEDVEISYTVSGQDAEVTLSCATADATIYYGFSEEDMTTEYSAPFTVSEYCTVYAYAKKGEATGETTSNTIKLFKSFKDITTKAEENDDITLSGNFSVLDKSDSYIFLTDGTSNLLIVGAAGNYTVGTAIESISGTISFLNKLPQLQDATLVEGGEGATYEIPELLSLSEVNFNDNIFDKIILKGSSISGKTSTTPARATITIGSETIPLYNALGVNFSNGDNYDITGYIWRYNETLQLVPSVITTGESIATVETPVFTPNVKELKDGETVTITCATAGATIYYTLDGSEPTQSSTPYTEPIEFKGDVTIKARAFYEADDQTMFPSDIAEKDYHFYDPYCNVITTDNHSDNHEGAQASYTKHTCTVDDVNYAMYGCHHATQGIQMNNKDDKNFCYIVQTGDNEGLALESIEVDFYSDPSTKKLIVRASNTPYDVFPDVEYNATAEKESIIGNGDKIGTIDKDNLKVEFAKDYNYFALYYPKENNTTGAIYMNSITIRYRKPAEANEADIPAFDDNFEVNIISDEHGLMTGALPSHEDWNAKYQVNDGEILDADTDGIHHEEELDDATLHTIKIWYEHYYHGTKSEENIFNHLTNPKVSENFNEGKTQFNFGTIGEGVKVYFTINGQNPTIETSTPANVIRRAKTVNGIYTIDSDEDKEATHSVSASNSIVEIDPTLLGDTYTIKAQAVHADTNTLSEVITRQGETTSIVELKGIGSEKAVYDLMGRKVQRPVHGIYIQEGVKVRL